MTAYYNEHDPFAAEWLENLILVGAIAPGIVDRRSIEDVQPADLKGFTQCHFFAGIGVWSHALRQAGWPDDRPVWTGSCPCPPFSQAGKKKACPECGGCRPIPHVGRTGYFVCSLCRHEWLADGRHLWPEFWRLIRDERPPVIFGEQVAGKDGLVWVDTVRASLEVLAYAVGAADLCAAGVGAPHIRQRSYWMAYDGNAGLSQQQRDPGIPCAASRAFEGRRIGSSSSASRLGRHPSGGRERVGDQPKHGQLVPTDEDFSGLADDDDSEGCCVLEERDGRPFGGGAFQSGANTHGRDELCGLLPFCAGVPAIGVDQPGREQRFVTSDGCACDELDRPGPTNGFWGNADWLFCRDGKWRPVEPGTFPLVNGASNRVGALRGYGNAIVAAQAQVFVEVGMEYLSCLS